MKVLRSTLVIGLAAFAAACGDKVNIVQPTTNTTPTVNSVTVTPGTATMSVGGTVNFTAAVDVSNGAATTVTWASSDNSKVSVDASGKATALAATPGVAICATSTVNTAKVGCASVVVSASVNIPATVSIQSITVNGTNGTTVDPTNVNGKIDVTLNVSPGSQTVQRVVLLVGGVRADSQVFTAAMSAALRYAADKAIETQTTFPQILFSINTGAYDATTGAPKWTNGQKAISAQLYTTAGGSTTAATATAQTNLTFKNVDGFAVSWNASTTTVPAGATDAAGYRWYGNGKISISAVPVMYSGSSVGTVTAAIGANGACAAFTAATASATTLTSGAYAITLNPGATASATPACQTAPNTIVITATNANGDNLTLATNGVVNTVPGLRWDNVAPGVPAFANNPNGRANNWVNDAVSFNTVVSTTNKDGWLAAAVTDANVGGTITYTVKAASGTTVAKAVAGTAMTSAASLANSPTNTTYCAVVYAADQLGNTVADPAAGACAGTTQTIAFGVDRIAPIVTVNTGAGNAKSLRIFNGANNLVFTLSDTGVNAAAANITVKGTAVRFGGTAAADTVTINSTVAPPTTTSTTAGSATNGYWTVSAAGSDQAGNSVTVTPYIYLVDGTAAGASNALQTNAGLTAGGAESFFATATDNVDLDSAYVTHNMIDGAAATWPFRLQTQLLQPSPFLVASPVKSVTVTGTWPAFPRGFATVASGAAISTASGALAAQVGTTAVTFWVYDQTDQSTGTLDAGSTANAPASIAYTAVNGPAAAAWANTNTAATVTIGSTRLTAAAALNQASGAGKVTTDTVTVTVAATGLATPPSAAPFSRGELWIRTNNATATGAPSAASKGFQLLSTLTPTLVYDGQAQTATWTYTYVFTPGKAYKAGTAFYGFVGYDSKFNALITPSAALTIAP
ncbi:MAG TPA: hypothetical protein VG916_14190 [Gemmatimonadaceae bacterium]|nr:hypothetical protein [Gemmatimonadaceae bacterium]